MPSREHAAHPTPPPSRHVRDSEHAYRALSPAPSEDEGVRGAVHAEIAPDDEGGQGATHARLAPDEVIARVAAAQRGVVTREQLRAAGIERGALNHRIARGRLHSIHPGVYLVGHPAELPLARETAAVLACGDGAVLSHRSAAWLWELAARPPGSTRAAFERDRRRDAELTAAGWRVMRVTWRALVDEREAMQARLATALVGDERRPDTTP